MRGIRLSVTGMEAAAGSGAVRLGIKGTGDDAGSGRHWAAAGVPLQEGEMHKPHVLVKGSFMFNPAPDSGEQQLGICHAPFKVAAKVNGRDGAGTLGFLGLLCTRKATMVYHGLGWETKEDDKCLVEAPGEAFTPAAGPGCAGLAFSTQVRAPDKSGQDLGLALGRGAIFASCQAGCPGFKHTAAILGHNLGLVLPSSFRVWIHGAHVMDAKSASAY